jgi:TolA-binding protein
LTALPTRTSIHALRRTAIAPLAGLVAGAIVLTSPVPAAAQEEISSARLRKIEAEIRALQRQVFPGGDGTFFEPQIRPSEAPSAPPARDPGSTTALTDVLARLDALEQQLQRLTGLTEENTNAITGLSARIDALETAAASGPAEPDDGGEETPRANDSNLAAMGAAASPAAEAATPAATPAPTAMPSASPAPQAGPSPQRLAAVQAIAKPQTDDAGDDAYSYGFRLWDAGFYPEARQALSKFVEDYPSHWRTSYARNLLGRAYLDDGQPEEAARWFLQNYQSDRAAARAPDSLLYLAETMIAIGDTRRACIALAEFGETYPAVASGRLSDQYERNRGRVTCEA